MEENLKQLLLKDLCARLPYNVVIRCMDNDTDYKCFLTTDILNELLYNIEYYDYKPYLRPMKSMTKEEKEEILKELFDEASNLFYIDKEGIIDGKPTNFWKQGYNSVLFCPRNINTYTDWLNAYHFDYHGLIEKGLAIDCTGLNIY